MHRDFNIGLKIATATVAALVCFPFASESMAQEAAAVPVPVKSVVTLSPETSAISFVGIHVGDDPKPRLGGFAKFTGSLEVNLQNKTIESMQVAIKVDSIWTEFEKLTTHLKNADFFEVDKYPDANFQSTKIEMGKDGQCTVTGDLTLHGETAAVSFPAEYNFSDGGLVFSSKFNLDRSKFGMDQMLSGVAALVDVEIQVGKKTVTPEAKAGHGGDSKKKQSSTEAKSATQTVSVNLPNMT